MSARRVTGVLALAALVGAALTGCAAGSLPPLPGASALPASAAASKAPSTSPSPSPAAGGGTAAGAVSAGSNGADVDCAAFSSALTTLFPGGTSAPAESEGTCTWGIGSNASASPSSLGNGLQDVFALHFDFGDDAATQYGGDVQFMGGADHTVPIAGVGSAAVYVPGSDGVPKVAAWSGSVACGATLLVSDAKTLGLTAPGAGRIVADADVAGLAKRIADACAIGWGG